MANTAIVTIAATQSRIQVQVRYPALNAAFTFSAGLTGTMSLTTFSINASTWTGRECQSAAKDALGNVQSGAYAKARKAVKAWRVDQGAAPAPKPVRKPRRSRRNAKAKGPRITCRNRMVKAMAADVIGRMFTPAEAARVNLKINVRQLRARLGGDAIERKSFSGTVTHHIRLNSKRSAPRMAEVLAHELRHIHQFVTGRLVWHTMHAGTVGHKWYGDEGAKTRTFKFFSAASTDSDRNYAGYRAAPWEVEARAAEPMGEVVFRTAVIAEAAAR